MLLVVLYSGVHSGSEKRLLFPAPWHSVPARVGMMCMPAYDMVYSWGGQGQLSGDSNEVSTRGVDHNYLPRP
jgi:hypothetical protein